MAWVRRVRTASGATAVQIAQYIDGRRRIVAHLGSAHTESELGLLLEQARDLLQDPDQDELSFGVEATPRKAHLIAPPQEPPQEPGLFAGPVQQLRGRQLPGRQLPGRRAGRAAAPRVIATSSQLLYDVLAGVYDGLGFGLVEDDTFRDLVIARIVEPTSILDTGRVLTDLGRTPASDKTMRRTLGRAQQRGYRDQIAAACFARACDPAVGGDVSLCLYDVTTLYFEADDEDDLRKVGYSKERRVDPQIVVGLLVDRGGFPSRSAASKATGPRPPPSSRS